MVATKLAISILCGVLSLACLLVVTADVQAAPVYQRGAVIGLQGPDLVIQEMIIRGLSGGEFPVVRVSVRVRNKGSAAAAPSEVLFLYTQDILSSVPLQVKHQKTGTIPAGGYEEIEFTYTGPLHGLLLAFVDAPVVGSPSGQVNEGPPVFAAAQGNLRIDPNNAFGATFTASLSNLPLRLQNPAEN